MTVTTAVAVLPRRVAGWAARRALARNSFTGIELGCSLCAAVWFSAGTSLTALGGGAALTGGYLCRRVARHVGPGGRPPGAPRDGWLGGDTAAPRPPSPANAFDGWLASACALAGELAVYAALAVGALAGQGGFWPLDTDQVGALGSPWKLATGAAVLLGLRKVVRLCRPGPAAPPAADAGQPGFPGFAALLSQVPAFPAGERALVITGTAVFAGPQFTLLVLTCWGAVALAWAVIVGPRAGRHPDSPAAPDTGRAGCADCRDDGPIARFAGSLVHGQLVPLPPAVAGLVATVLLTMLGLGDLAGPVLLTPVAAMLLAAPGSAHPHSGPLDWLTPAIIQAGQYIYLGALGFARGVPSPVTFALIGLVALRQLDVAYQARHPLPGPGPRGGLGWEGRMLAAGAGAIFGIATFSYLALAAYLGWLLCTGGLSSWFALRSGLQAAGPASAVHPQAS
jgi:Family of unknown function (DUF5941)